MSMARLPPGFRFHPTDVELIMYYLKRKIMGKKLLFDAITELNIYKFSPWDLPEKCCYKSKDLEWYFFCPRERKYASGARMNRATETGYWKTTGKDRSVKYDEKVVGSVKTLIFHQGHPPKGLRTDWVIHEYKFEDKSLVDAGFVQDAYVLCRVFQKSGPGPNNGAQYGAPFKEEDWEDEVVAEPCAADVFAAPPVTSVVHPVSPSVWATSEPSLCTIQPSNQKMPLDEQDEELLGEPNPSNLSSINWMPLDKLENEGDSPGGLNLSSIFYKQSTSMVDPGSGPSNEWPLDEQDEEMIGLLAHFTDDPSLVSASDKNNQIQNPANFNQDINAITPPFTDGNCILDSLGDIENWVGQGQFSANYCPDPAIQQDGAYLELNDLETPLYHFTETEQLVPDNFCISNVDMQKLCFESNSLGMHLDTCNNQLPMLPESYTQQVYNFPNNESQGFSAAANFSFGSYKQSDDSRLAAQSLERVYTAFPTAIFNENARIPMLSSDNYVEWKEKVLLILGCSDLDMALRVDEPPTLTESSTPEDKAFYKQWERSNRLSLMLIKAHISQGIKGSIPNTDKVRAYMMTIDEHFVSSDKALASTLMKVWGLKGHFE